MSGNIRSPAESPSFDKARAETIRYHRELYATTDVGKPGTWLAKPHRLVLDALDLVDGDRPITAYDLGAGIGRHTIPIVERVPPGSRVVAVDLLPAALERLRANAPEAPGVRLDTVAADLAEFEFDAPAELVIAFSAVEHLPDLRAIRRLLGRIAAATAVGGIVAIGIVADRREVDADGTERPALVESQIIAEQARDALDDEFGGFAVLQRRDVPARATESRDGDDYVLASTLVTFLAQRRG